jgi:uncharacterized membrane protein YagU involved in acid resistance
MGFCQHGCANFNSCGKSGLWHDSNEYPLLAGDNLHAQSGQGEVHRLFLHFINGWIFSLIYVAAFQALQVATWWFGATIDFVHGVFVLTMALPVLPSLHPRTANEQYGPTVVRQLEPPGFLGLHYGIRTPLTVLVAHVIFGIILGTFYVVK